LINSWKDKVSNTLCFKKNERKITAILQGNSTTETNCLCWTPIKMKWW